MTCILKPECNFLNRYFRCLLPLETVNTDVKIKMVRGIHTFQRDRTMQIMKCNPWSTKLHPYPSLIWKMKMYLELEGKLGPKPRPQPQTQLQPRTSAPSQSNPPQNNNQTRKAQDPRCHNKRRTRVPAKRRYKVRVIAQPIPATPALTAPVNLNPMVL